MTITCDSQIQMVSNQAASSLGKETILIDYEQGNYYELNEVGGFIWSIIQTEKAISVRDIQERVLTEFAVEQSVYEQEAILFLTSLWQENLIAVIA
ncbi:hypothetical protein GCM10028805_09710 [Spirosoma harenae]